MFILFWITLISFVILVTALALRMSAIRDGRISAEPQPGIYSAIEPKIDYLATIFVVALRQTSKFFSMHILLASHNLLSKLRQKFGHWEKRYGRFINMIHGKHELPLDTSNVSDFLKDIKEQADEIHGAGEEKK